MPPLRPVRGHSRTISVHYGDGRTGGSGACGGPCGAASPTRRPASKPGRPVALPGARRRVGCRCAAHGWTIPPRPQMCRSAVGVAAARQGPAAGGAGAGMDRHSPGEAPPASPGSMVGCAGQDGRGLTGVGGRAGSSGQHDQLGGARGAHLWRPAQVTTPARPQPAAPAAVTASMSPAVPRPLQGRSVGCSRYPAAVVSHTGKGRI